MQNMGRGRIFARNGIYIQEQGFGQGLGWNVKALANQHRSEKIEVGLGWGEAENIHCMALAKKNETHPGVGLSLMLGEVLTVSGTVKPAQVREYGGAGGWGRLKC